MYEKETTSSEAERSDQTPVLEGISTHAKDVDSSNTDHVLLQSLETSMSKLKVRMTERSVRENHLRDDRNRLQEDNDLLRAQYNATQAQLRNAEERTRMLERALDDERRQRAEMLKERDTEIVNERSRADALNVDSERLEHELSTLRQEAENSFANEAHIGDQASWLAQVFRSRYINPQPDDYTMTTSTGHCGPHGIYHPTFGRLRQLGCFIDWNGEIAWLKVYLVTQLSPLRVTYR